MIWNYPVATEYYIVAAILAVLPFWHRFLNVLTSSRVFALSFGAALVVCFALFPSNNHLLGDGVQRIAQPSQLLIPSEPLDYLIHNIAASLLGSMLISYRVVAVVAGAAYVWFIIAIARMGRTPLERAIFALSFLAIATVQFYFGYAESYTLANVLIAWYVLSGWQMIQSRQHSFRPLIFFVVASLSHFSALCLLPSLIILYRKRLTAGLVIVVSVICVAGFGAALAVGLDRVLVPFVASEYSHYTFFSGQHLHDVVKTLLLVAPAFALVFWHAPRDRRQKFTLVAVAGALLFAVAVDPKIGAFRDWDLLAIFALPLAALIALRAPRHPATVSFLVVIIGIRIAPWVDFNRENQAAFIAEAALSDIHYTSRFDNGSRLRAFGLQLERMGNLELAAEAFDRKLAITPSDVNTLRMHSRLAYKMGDFGRSYELFVRLLKLQPQQPDNYPFAGHAALKAEKIDEGLAMIRGAPPEAVALPEMAAVVAGLLAASGRFEAAAEIATTRSLVFYDSDLVYLLALACLRANAPQDAARLIEQAIVKDPENQKYLLLRGEIQSRLADTSQSDLREQ